MTDALPDLPAGYTLDQGSATPALPQGYTLDDSRQAPVRTGMPSLMPNILSGLATPLQQFADMINKAAPGLGLGPTVETTRRGLQAYEDQGLPSAAGDVAHFIGSQVLPTAASFAIPGAGAAGLLPRMAAGAGAGAISGALQPVEPNAPDFWSQTRNNALFGAGAGAAAPPLLGGLARMVSPNVSEDVQRLRNAGVNLTPGQIQGGTANRLEQAAGSAPFAGDFIKNARRAALVDFNRGAINQALSPIGETLENAPGTRAAISEMNDKIDAAYNTLKPRLGWMAQSPASAQLNNDLGQLRANVNLSFPKQYADEFNRDLDLLVNARLSSGGGITGDSFKAAESDLRKFGVSKASNPNSLEWDHRLAGAYFQAKALMRNAQGLADPDAAAQLAKIDYAYSHALRVSDAAGRLGGEPGLFTTAQLQASSKKFDESLRDKAFSQGEALLQKYAEAGKSVLGNTVPDSGTPYRQMLNLGFKGGALGLGARMGGEALEGVPVVGKLGELALPALAGYGALSGLTGLAYSPLARRAIGAILASRPSGAESVANAIRSAAPAASAAAPWALSPLGLGSSLAASP